VLDLKSDFPTLSNNPNLAYFDSAASTQTHSSVLKAMNNYYENFRSNTNRGEYPISERASMAMDVARSQVANLINVSPSNIMFTGGTTQSLNLVARWMKDYKTVLVTEAEHNANIVPWLTQGRSVDRGNLLVMPINDFDGCIDMYELEKLLQEHASGHQDLLVSICATSNVTGVTQPWGAIADLSHKYGATVCVDFCQTVAHEAIDLKENQVEFAVFSGHKTYGPTGIGALYTSFDFDDLFPQYFGGGAVESVTFNNVSLKNGVDKHCPGTPDIANIIGFGVACEMLKYVGFPTIYLQEQDVLKHLLSFGIDCLPNSKVFPVQGFTNNIITLIPEKGHSADVGVLMANTDVAIRTGKVCAHPIVDRISGGKGIVRISFAPYNDIVDCKKLCQELELALLKIK
jgi:cysteine desulfurase/selenocysteine lyase